LNKVCEHYYRFIKPNGDMSPVMLARPPFSDIHFEGVFGLFDDSVVMDLRNRIKRVEAQAVVGIKYLKSFMVELI